MFDKFQASFQIPDTQWNYREVAFYLKECDKETIVQFGVHCIDVLLRCVYSEPAGQLQSGGFIPCC